MNPETALQSEILSLLRSRREGATICPSEAARRAIGEDWRAFMETTREVSRRLAMEGQIEIRQRGKTLDPSAPFCGPIRLAISEPPA